MDVKIFVGPDLVSFRLNGKITSGVAFESPRGGAPKSNFLVTFDWKGAKGMPTKGVGKKY